MSEETKESGTLRVLEIDEDAVAYVLGRYGTELKNYQNLAKGDDRSPEARKTASLTASRIQGMKEVLDNLGLGEKAKQVQDKVVSEGRG